MNKNVPGLEVWNRNFLAKVTRLLHKNDKKYLIQSNLHCYLHIFLTSPEGDECHANKTVRLLNQTSYPAILVHFRTKWSVVQRERGPVMRTDGNPTEPSLEYFPTERLDRFLDPFPCVWWGIIVKKNDFVLPSSIIRSFFL